MVEEVEARGRQQANESERSIPFPLAPSIVADTGNLRLQSFTPEGHHISSFDCPSLGRP